MVAILDTRWSARKNANEATTICFDAMTLKVAAFWHTMRRGPKKNFDGSSKEMEGHGVKKICEILKNDGITIDAAVHDGDASTMKQCRDTFGDHVEDYQDLNHRLN